MATIELKYGHSALPFEYDEGRFDVLGRTHEYPPLSDAEIGEKLGSPIDSPPVEDIISLVDSILIVVPDATRQTGCDQVVNLLVRRLIANGSEPSDINIIFATGIHRAVTSAEKEAILTPFIAQRIKTLDHSPRDLMRIARMGETSGGIPVELNRAVIEHDRVILIGGISFHYFAGFTGGRKLICPGLASARTITETHKLAFDCETMTRREGVDTGLLDGNAVNEAFIEAVEKAPPSFAISTIVDDAGRIVDLFCGDWKISHRAACDVYAAVNTVRLAEKRNVVVASCGGFPHDINMIQAHKSLEAASKACIDGGTIVLLAECSDGLGRTDFLKWFEIENSESMARTLCQKYQVNGQTAWSLLKKAERFDVKIVTALESETTASMRLAKIDGLDGVSNAFGETSSGYILPNAAKLLIET